MTTAVSTDTSSLLSDYISSQSASTTSSTTTSSDSDSLYGDYSTFLNLLVTQLQNQDPTEPTDVSTFTQQLVEYSQVEQQINTNDKLDEILSAINPNGITPLLSYVGAYVEAPSDGTMVVQDSQGMVGYTLDEEALSVSIAVTDSSGDTIATLTGDTDTGTHRLVWDGTCTDGTTAEDGTYSFKLTATDSNGDAIDVSDVRVIGKVTGIETDSDGTAVLMAGKLEINDEDVDAVWANIGTTSSTDDTASTDDTTTDSST